MRPRRNNSATFTAKVAMEAIKGKQTLTELSQRFDVHMGQITQWENQFLERATEIFERSAKPSDPTGGHQGVARQDRRTDPGE